MSSQLVEMSSRSVPYAHMSDDEIIRTGKRLGYGNWLQPIINANDHSSSHLDSPATVVPASSYLRRSRGRPKIAKPRDESAIERRRAQVREAQRTYQKRKDTVAATEKRRTDQLIQLLADLSSDIEGLLHSGFKAGCLYQEDDVSKTIQRLWVTYDTVINDESVQPELRLQKVKNDDRQAQRQASTHSNSGPSTNSLVGGGSDTIIGTSSPRAFHADTTSLNFSLDGSPNIMLPRPLVRGAAKSTIGRSIYDIVKERQTTMKEDDRRNKIS